MWRRRILRGFAAIFLLLVLVVAVLLIDGWVAFGRAPNDPVRLAKIEKSAAWGGGEFENPQPIINDFWGMLDGLTNVSEDVNPHEPPAVVATDPSLFEAAPASGLRFTWFGHSTTLIELDGHRVLTDPSWSERSGPYTWIGPKRYFPAPLPIDKLPALDAVIISHDHYDHLDYRTILALKDRDLVFVTPLGVGSHLEYWGVPAQKIVELDWWENTRVRELDITCVPARHQSGRLLPQNQTLWGSYALAGKTRRVYFSGDTGLFPAMKEIGEKLGPFDLTMIEVGQYHGSWPDWHIGPEQAVTGHRVLRGRVMFPMHWGGVTLAYHSWTEPIERVLAEAKTASVAVVAPKPGESIEPMTAPQPPPKWWPELSWQTAAEAPIVSSQVSF